MDLEEEDKYGYEYTHFITKKGWEGCVRFRGPFMKCTNHLNWNLSFNERTQGVWISRNEDKAYVYFKVSGIDVVPLGLYMGNVQFKENHVLTLQSVKASNGYCFTMKNMWEETYNLK